MDTYIISLNNPKKMLNDLSLIGLNPILFNAVNGECKKNRKLIKSNISRFWDTFGPKSSIGCALSHLLVWKKLIKSKKENCVVFEDDIIYNKNLDIKVEIENALNLVPKNFDILYLGSVILPLPFDSIKINKKIEKPNIALATHAYIISRRCAKKLLKLMYNKKYIFQHIDLCLQYLSYRKFINTFIISPRIIFQTSTNNIESSSNSTNNHPIILQKFLSKFKIDKYVKANYLSTVSCFRIFSTHITCTSFLIMFLGVCFSKSNTYWLSFIFILLSIPDKMSVNVLLHYLLFVTPSIVL